MAVWGERGIPELEAEDRLAFACEKAPTEDIVALQVRHVSVAENEDTCKSTLGFGLVHSA